MSFWRTYYHLIWATESRQPLITRDRESELYGYIIGKADAMGCIIHAVGGVEDHIHTKSGLTTPFIRKDDLPHMRSQKWK